jgi:hypothetical protein
MNFFQTATTRARGKVARQLRASHAIDAESTHTEVTTSRYVKGFLWVFFFKSFCLWRRNKIVSDTDV